MLCASLGFVALLVVPALDHRFGWSRVSLVGVVTGDVLVAVGFYLIAFLYLVGTPPALGSCWGLVPMAVLTPVLIWRLLDEERLLARDLAGYTEYQKRVRHRLVPFVW